MTRNAYIDIYALKKFDELKENLIRFELLVVSDVITLVLVSED